MTYSTGVNVASGSLLGTERVEIDNGGAQKIVATAGQIAMSPGAFGSGTAKLMCAGNISTQVSATGISPAATGADKVLAVFSLPANSFDIAGRTIQIQAEGGFGSNGNNKQIKLIFNATTAVVGQTVSGGTTVADTGTVTTNGGGWALSAEICKYGNPGSNTQMAVHQQAQVGGAVSALLAPAALTATESGAILIAVTGNATTTATDIALNFLQIFAQN